MKIIANSVEAFFAMNTLSENKIDQAFAISPIINMKKLIEDMMKQANVSGDELHETSAIEASFGQTLSWEYLSYTKTHQIKPKNSRAHFIWRERQSHISHKDF